MGRYTWKHDDGSSWSENFKEVCYFQEAWYAADAGVTAEFCVIRVGNEFFAAPLATLNRNYDIGPFATPEAAQVAAVFAVGTGAFDGPFEFVRE